MSISESEGYGRRTENPGHREIAEDVYLLKECIMSSQADEDDEEALPDWIDPGEQLHGSQNAYLVAGEETLVFDTWSPQSEDTIRDEIDAVLDGRGLDYLVPSHPESNHAANTWEIMDAYPEATLVAPARGAQHELYGYTDDVLSIRTGETLDLGGPVVEFHEPIFLDHAMTTYLFERRSETLFTVDWCGFQHMSGECMAFADEMTYDVTADQLDRFTGYALGWLRFADPDKVEAAIDRLMAETDPSVIAPAHGQPIRRDVDAFMELMTSVMRDITESGIGDEAHVHTHQSVRYGGSE